jgi:hypothetical protein
VPQLTKQQIDVIAAECLEARPEPKTTLWYSHCEDGAYDEQSTLSRKFIYEGFNYLIATKMWVDDQVANKRLPEWMQAPWGTYPDMPPKPPKK